MIFALTTKDRQERLYYKKTIYDKEFRPLRTDEDYAALNAVIQPFRELDNP